jgi:hypothetical protein
MNGLPFQTRPVETHERKVCMFTAKVDGSAVDGGTLTTNGLDTGAAQHMKITEVGDGIYDLTLNNPGQRFVGVSGAGITNQTGIAASEQTAGSVMRIRHENMASGSVEADGDFYVQLWVSYAADPT